MVNFIARKFQLKGLFIEDCFKSIESPFLTRNRHLEESLSGRCLHDSDCLPGQRVVLGAMMTCSPDPDTLTDANPDS